MVEEERISSKAQGKSIKRRASDTETSRSVLLICATTPILDIES